MSALPDMDVAIGIGRAIMQHEAVALLARPLLAQLAIEVDLVPAGEEFRLTPGQAGAHREIRLRQVEGGSVIGRVVDGRVVGLVGHLFQPCGSPADRGSVIFMKIGHKVSFPAPRRLA